MRLLTSRGGFSVISRGTTLYAFGGIAGIYAIDTFGPAWTSAPVDYVVQGGGDPLLPFTGAAPLW